MEGDGHDRGVRRWGVGCKRPEAERAGCQSRAGAVYDGGELVLVIGRSRWRGGWKFQRGVATAGGVWAEGGGRVVVRLRGGEQCVEGRAAETGGLSAIAMDGGSERGLSRQFTWCGASNRGGSAWCLLSQKPAMSRAVRRESTRLQRGVHVGEGDPFRASFAAVAAALERVYKYCARDRAL